MPDLTGRVVVVTGGNAGIGKVMCRELLAHNARVYMLCRNPTKAEAAIEELKSATGKSTIWPIQCDLCSLPSVLSAARELLAWEDKLHLLFCNAGMSERKVEELTEEGYDLAFGVNVLAHAYLIKLLLPRMCETAKRCEEGTVRVVNLASSAPWAAPKSGIDYTTLKDSPARTKAYDRGLSYFQSKWANVAYTHSLASHYPLADNHVLFLALDPGWISTQMWAFQDGFAGWVLQNYILSDVEHGALTPLFVGTAEGVRQGAFYVPWAREGRSRPDTGKKDKQERLWDWIEKELEGRPLA